jgi:hypothetical protein
MRPLTAFENKIILDYNKASYLNDIRYKCVRALEVDAASGGASGSRSDYFNSMLALSNAIRTELGLSAADESPVAAAEIEALQAKITAQEDELISQDDKIAGLEAQFASIGQLPLTSKEADTKYTKAELLALLYPHEA